MLGRHRLGRIAVQLHARTPRRDFTAVRQPLLEEPPVRFCDALAGSEKPVHGMSVAGRRFRANSPWGSRPVKCSTAAVRHRRPRGTVHARWNECVSTRWVGASTSATCTAWKGSIRTSMFSPPAAPGPRISAQPSNGHAIRKRYHPVRRCVAVIAIRCRPVAPVTTVRTTVSFLARLTVVDPADSSPSRSLPSRTVCRSIARGQPPATVDVVAGVADDAPRGRRLGVPDHGPA